MNLRKKLKKIGGEIVYRLKPGRRSSVEEARAHPAFAALGAGDIAIDCGANHGVITAAMAANGAEVHAFEPNPDAFAVLTERFKGAPNVRLYPQAVLDKPGTMTLFLHLNYARNPARFSQGSSLFAEKRNVSESGGVEVGVIDLSAFIGGLGRPVKLVKIDVEGAEYAILNGLIDSGMIHRVDQLLVETHASMIESLRLADTELRARIHELGLGEKIDLNGI